MDDMAVITGMLSMERPEYCRELLNRDNICSVRYLVNREMIVICYDEIEEENA